jgi:hypothetical protein
MRQNPQISEEIQQVLDLIDSARTCLLDGHATNGSALWRLVDACGLLAQQHHGHAPGTSGQPTGRRFYIATHVDGQNLMPVVDLLTTALKDLRPWAEAYAETQRVPLHPPGPLARIAAADRALAEAAKVLP